MKIKKGISILIIFVLCFITINTKALAQTQINANIKSNTNEIKSGEEVEITLKLNEFVEVESGINAYKATLEYNKEIFEEVLQNDFTCLNGWENLKYNRETGEFVAIKRVGSRTEEDVVKLTLTLKENVVATKTDIKIKDIVASEGTFDLILEDKIATIQVIQEQAKNPTPMKPSTNKPSINGSIVGAMTNTAKPVETPNTNENNNSTSGNFSSNSDNTKEENSTKPESNEEISSEQEDSKTPTKIKIPKTLKKYAWLFILLIIENISVILYLLFKRRKNEKEDDKNKNNSVFMSFLIVGILISQCIGTCYATLRDFSLKGELNGDKIIDYNDVSLLELHLIHSQILPNEKLENADMNSDGKITVTDLTLLIKKLEKTLDYQVTLADREQETYYPKKMEEITLKFFADVSYGADIEKVVVNNVEYSVLKEENTIGEYSIKVSTEHVSGVKDYHFTEVILENEKRVKVDYTIKVDILKDKPTFQNYVAKEDINDSTINLSFDLVDIDCAFVSAKLEIFNENDELVEIREVKVGKNEIKIELEEKKIYSAHFTISYDLDTNQLTDYQEDTTGREYFVKDLVLLADYQFEIGNLKTYRQEEETSTFVKEEEVILGFTSTNASKYLPYKAIVDGKEYSVTKVDNYYMVNLGQVFDLGEKEFTLEAIILENGRKFEINEENKIKVEIIKKKPLVENFSYEESVEENKINVQFDLKDEDLTTTHASIILLDQNGDIIESKNIDLEKKQITKVSIDLTTKLTSKYIVKVLANYNQTEKEEDLQVGAILFEKEIKALPRAKVTQVDTNQSYVEKGKEVVLTYTIESNYDEAVKEIRINNVNYPATQVDGKYQIVVQVPEISGIAELYATKVIYSDAQMATIESIVRVDVLKEKPNILNYVQQDNLDKKEVLLTFQVEDLDHSFLSGKIVVTKEDGTKMEIPNIEVGDNKVSLIVEEMKKYALEIMITYDLDTNTLEGTEELDNRIIDDVLMTQDIQLIGDYQLKVEDVATYHENRKTNYFNKKEKVTFQFTSTNVSEFVPVKAIINDIEYTLEKEENTYQTELGTYTEAGVKTFTLEKIILSNGKELDVENKQVKFEIIKDVPTIKNFSYRETEDGKITIHFDAMDNDSALQSANVRITDEYNNQVKQENIKVGQNIVSFPLSASERYYVEIFVDYDLDTNAIDADSNMYTNIRLFNEEIDTTDRLFEMKDIKDVTLYKKNGEEINEVTNIKEADLANLEDYLVYVSLDSMPSFYAKIREYKIEDSTLKFVLDYDNVVQYKGLEKQNKLEVTYGYLSNETFENKSLEALIQAMNDNPSGDFILYKDYDMSTLNVSGGTIITSIFTGTLNGNGHTLSNLTKPLFNSMSGAKVENLVIQNASVTAQGVLAQTASGVTISNVHLKDIVVKAPNNNGTGSLIGIVNQNSLIENVSATNITVGSAKVIGGLIGNMSATTIQNVYIEGTVSSNNDAAGGAIGIASSNSLIENMYVNVVTNFSWTSGSIGGMIGHPTGVTLKNSVSLATAKADGHGARVYGSYSGSAISTASKNVFELETSNMRSNAGSRGIIAVSEEETKTKSFYTNTLGWSEDIWDLTNVENGNYPVLKGADPNYKGNIKNAPKTPNVYIPDYERLSNLSTYDEEKEILYHNMYKLMPFYDAKYYVLDGNKLSKDHILNQKIIKTIFAYDENEDWIVALSEQNPNQIKKIQILFTDNETVTYSVNYKEVKNKVAQYELQDLALDYSYDKYLVDTSSSVYQYIVNQIKNYDYTNDIAVTTPEEEVRNYTENYAHVQEQAERFALNFMANTDAYHFTISNSILENKLKQDLETNTTLKNYLYAYNYFDRFYNIEIGGINMRDIVFFDGSIFDEKLNPTVASSTLIHKASENYRSTGALHTYFASYIQPIVGKNLADFLEYFIKYLTEDKYKQDPASWIIDHFDGTIYEASAPRYTEIRYRVWDHLKARSELLLPVLSYRDEDLYVLGIPTCILVGNLNSYVNVPNTTKEQRQVPLINFANLAITFYDSIAGVVENTRGYQNMLNRSMISYDSTANRNWSGVENTPKIYKNFFEVMGKYTVHGSASAYANGTDIYWIYNALSSYVIYTHEAVHNQDGNTFLEGTGRRSGAGAEHFTDNFLTQSGGTSGVYGVVPNYTYTRPITSTVTNNISKDRVNTRDKIESYYKGMYDAFAFLDYIEAEAFLQLTPEEQAKIAQVIEGTTYKWKTAEDFRNMNLQTIEDLWDNHLVIIRGNKAYTTGSLWYIYENPNVGAASKAFFVLNAYQFLADFGYAGYVAYAGNTYGSKTDGEILKILSGDEEMTFKSYQLGRYEEAKEKAKNFPYIDVEEAIERTKEAMEDDVKNNIPIHINSNASVYREALYGYLKRITNDFETSIYDEMPNVVHITNASEFLEKVKNNPEVNIVLDNDIDFRNIPTSDDAQTILGDFVGLLEGNNHKITGLTKPLFNRLVFAKIQNVTFENADVTLAYNTSGVLAKTIDFSFLKNITLKNVNVTGTSIVGGLSGTINRTTVKNITYETNVQGTVNPDYIGGLFGKATYSTIENVHGVNTTVQGRGHVGGIVGDANYVYELKESTFNGTVTGTTNSIGGLIGYVQNSSITDCYTLGSVTGVTYVGGLLGNAFSTTIENCYSRTNVTGNALASTGGMLGSLTVPTNATISSSIRNSIFLGRVNMGYKFYAVGTKEFVEASYKNNFELKEAIGHETSEKTGIDFVSRISTIALKDVNENFYTNILGWNSKIWDFTNVSVGGLPKLKNLDKNNETTVMERIEIRSIQDFLKINDNPSGDYILTSDIDFTGYTKEDREPLITAIFTGRLDGAGHTISNLENYTLFMNFRGTVTNLTIQDFNYISTSEEAAAFARNSSNATFSNMRFENITLEGTHRVAVVVGTDNANSTFDHITVKNANVKGSGVYVSTFIGRKYGGKISNVYVEGNLEVTTTENGGLIGALQTAGTIQNVVTNVNIYRPRSTDSRNQNGGMIGNIINAGSSIQNAIAIGSMSGFTNNDVEVNPYKFTGASDERIQSSFENCYEYVNSTGISRVSEDTTGILANATFENLHSKAFYKNTLHFDETIWNLDDVETDGVPKLR